MTKSIMNFTKGIVTGVVIGAAVNMVIHGCCKSNKKNNGNMIKNFGSFVSHINDMMK